MRRSVVILVMSLVATACFSNGGETSESTRPTGGPSTIPSDSTTTTLDPRPCRLTTVIAPTAPAGGVPPTERVPSGNPHAAAVAVSQATFDCASDVVVVDTLDLDRVALAALLAADHNAPLLFGDPGASSLLAYELDRLAPERVWVIGDSAEAPAPEWAEVTRISGSLDEMSAAVAERVAATDGLALPAFHGIDTVSVAIEAMATGRTLLPPSTDPGTAVPVKEDDIAAGSGASGMVWLVDRNEHAAAMAAAVGAVTSDGFMTLVRGEDLRMSTAASQRLGALSTPVSEIQIVGGTNDAGWQAMVLLRGDQIPGGGFLMFPGRRLVALYGNPLTTSLGVLGEQGPEDGLARLETLSAGYGADGLQVLPTFELIATVAAGNAGGDGNYSNEMDVDLLRSWVDVAAREGAYVLLDLQPGRAHFLEQAKIYEELLLEPHVGLALDPEWKLKPDQFPLQQIGQVEAAEVNEVVEWLAALVRDNALPQKLLLLHQFTPRMLQDRDQIMETPELTLVIQMDGQGVIETKHGSWARTTEGWENDQFEYGWKNFFDEDVPGPVGPDVILDLVPTAVYVSFQ